MSTRPIKVLSIEDDELDRMIIKRAMNASGMLVELSFADDIESGREATNGKTYDCIFLDYNLPGGTGLELLKYIRKSGNDSPIIIVTSHGDEKIAVEAMKSGASDYIPKNLLTADGLAQSLRYVIRMKQAEERRLSVERELKETQKSLATVVANSQIILFSIDAKGIITIFEGKGMAGVGIDTNALSKKNINEISDYFLVIKEDYAAVMQGQERERVLELGDKFIEVSYSRVHDEAGKINGVIGVASDITAFKQAEQQLLQAKRIAEEASKMKEQFLANMSHEIRTPMNGIVGLTRILLNSNGLDDEQRKYLQSIKVSSDNLMIIINDILDVSKIEAGKLSFEETPFSVSEIVNQTMDLFKAKADEKSVALICDVDNDIPQHLLGDPTRLSQILNNLVSNSIKFTEKGSVVVKIKTRNVQDNKVTLDFEVKDTGMGIPQESLNVVFESFTQASAETARKFGGTGLGLTIVKKLVELQNGTIGVRSRVNEGTTISFNITYTITNSSKAEVKKDYFEAYRNRDISHLSVLCAEDNLINQMVLKKILNEWKVKAVFADNGRIAVEKLKEQHFDIVLMDVQMPEMDGYTATRTIRSTLEEPAASVPILAVTGSATTAGMQRCYDSGMNDFISKPYDHDELRKKIIELTCDKSAVGSQQSAVNKLEDLLPTANRQLPTDDHVTDLTHLRHLAEGNIGFVIEMLEMFLSKTPSEIELVKKYFKDKQWDELRQITHKIKPTFGYIGLKDIQEALATIESNCANKIHLDKLKDLVDKVAVVSVKAFKELEEELTAMK